jgi:hypothetical protein
MGVIWEMELRKLNLRITNLIQVAVREKFQSLELTEALDYSGRIVQTSSGSIEVFIYLSRTRD